MVLFRKLSGGGTFNIHLCFSADRVWFVQPLVCELIVLLLPINDCRKEEMQISSKCQDFIFFLHFELFSNFSSRLDKFYHFIFIYIKSTKFSVNGKCPAISIIFKNGNSFVISWVTISKCSIFPFPLGVFQSQVVVFNPGGFCIYSWM